MDVHPTTDAHTFMGWALSAQGRLDEATEEGRRAIEVDPQCGNRYDDIAARKGVISSALASTDPVWCRHGSPCRGWRAEEGRTEATRRETIP
jgi:hypothetical protein